MFRVSLIIANLLAVIVAAALLAGWWDFAGASEEGKKLHDFRTISRSGLEVAKSNAPLVVWMGDSTMVSHGDNTSYAVRVSQALGPRVAALVRIRPGLCFYHYYWMLGDVLEAEPNLIVANLNLRLMDPALSAPHQNLASSIPSAELSRAFGLPFHEIGLTLPHLLLVRLLRIPALERAYYFATGLRQRFHDASWWPGSSDGFTGPSPAAAQTSSSRWFAAYDDEVSRDDSMVQMIQATVSLATRGGAEILVVVSPIPWEELQRAGLYERERAQRRIGVLRDAVEITGGQLLDLHDVVGRKAFLDRLGHVDSGANDTIKQKLVPVVRELLDASKRQRAHRHEP